MNHPSTKAVGLGLGAFVLAAAAWTWLEPQPSVAIKSRAQLESCDGETGRFQMQLGRNRQPYLLDTCSGNVWAFLPSPDKLEPGAWIVMDRYDTREDVTRLLDYLRGLTPPATTETVDPDVEATTPGTDGVYPQTEETYDTGTTIAPDATDQSYPETEGEGEGEGEYVPEAAEDTGTSDGTGGWSY